MIMSTVDKDTDLCVANFDEGNNCNVFAFAYWPQPSAHCTQFNRNKKHLNFLMNLFILECATIISFASSEVE